MITKIEGKCQYERCDQDATNIAHGRKAAWRPEDHGLGLFCKSHADIVADENSPEYNVDCPNCGCMFGVN